MENINDYIRYFNISLRNLLFFKDNTEIYKSLYYNRTRDLDKIKGIFRNIRNTGDNILITGSAGTGKTNFIYRVFFETEFLKKYNLYPIIVDYGESYSYKIVMLNFIRDMISFFKENDYDIHTIDETNLDEENINTYIHLIKIHLNNFYNINKGKTYLLIFLDDLDYMEDELFELLEQFYTIAICKHVSIILSARPKLYLSIYHYSDRFSVFFTRNVERVKLKPLPVEKLIATRIAYILEKEHQANKSIIQIITSFFSKKDKYIELLEKMGVSNVENLDKIPLPFSSELTNFMSVITNNNIREILDLSHDFLIYILSNFDNLETIVENRNGIDVEKKYIPEHELLEFLTTSIDDLDEDLPYKRNFQLFNLHKIKNIKGNSLYLNTLEAIRAYEIIDQRIYNTLKKLKHSRSDVDNAIKILSNKAHRMIVEKRYVPKEYRNENNILHKEYQLTEKGAYYLTNINNWESYNKKFGQSNQHLNDIL